MSLLVRLSVWSLYGLLDELLSSLLMKKMFVLYHGPWDDELELCCKQKNVHPSF